MLRILREDLSARLLTESNARKIQTPSRALKMMPRFLAAEVLLMRWPGR